MPDVWCVLHKKTEHFEEKPSGLSEQEFASASRAGRSLARDIILSFIRNHRDLEPEMVADLLAPETERWVERNGFIRYLETGEEVAQ